METRAFKIGNSHGEKSGKSSNPYIRKNKIQEYEEGFQNGIKTFMSKSIKNKPQMFHNSMARHGEKQMTISIRNGIVDDVIRENTDCKLIVHDYDIEGIDPETNIHCEQDENGQWFQKIILE